MTKPWGAWLRLSLVGLGLTLGKTAAAQDQASPLSRVVGGGLREMSPWSMFMSADVVVKVVMVGLACASLATWTVFLAKTVEILISRRRLLAALKQVSDAASLAEARSLCSDHHGALARLLATAAHEGMLSNGLARGSGILDRAGSSLEEIVRAERRNVRRGLGVLATIGSTAPFIGLFGTVWGIMTSFIGISRSQTTNLAVVAPGIAEALLATAIGLVAAIPAVIIYNHFTRATGAYLDLVGRAAGVAARLLSRELDHKAPPIERAAE